MKAIAGIGLMAIGLAVSSPIIRESKAADRSSRDAAILSRWAVQHPKGAAFWYAVPSCEHVAAEAAQPDYIDRIEDEFEKVYPGELVGFKDGSAVVLDPANLRQVVMYLACAGVTVGGGLVSDNALALFDSKRYGMLAFRILEDEAKSSGKYSAMAAAFHDQMKKNVWSYHRHLKGLD
jgi:hypothetical protein